MPMHGYLTPSTFADLMTNGRGTDTFGASAQTVIDKLAMDLIGVRPTDECMQTFPPLSCKWGLENEWEAVKAYEERMFCEVIRPEFRTSPTHPYVGGTADGLVGKHGGIEIKCPYNPAEHMENILTGKQVKQYIYQMQGYIHIYGLDWIDFVSFDPRYEDAERLYTQRVYRDDEMIGSILNRCAQAYILACSKAELVRRRLSA